jgi:hypothetical protein
MLCPGKIFSDPFKMGLFCQSTVFEVLKRFEMLSTVSPGKTVYTVWGSEIRRA